MIGGTDNSEMGVFQCVEGMRGFLQCQSLCSRLAQHPRLQTLLLVHYAHA